MNEFAHPGRATAAPYGETAEARDRPDPDARIVAIALVRSADAREAKPLLHAMPAFRANRGRSTRWLPGFADRGWNRRKVLQVDRRGSSARLASASLTRALLALGMDSVSDDQKALSTRLNQTTRGAIAPRSWLGSSPVPFVAVLLMSVQPGKRTVKVLW